MDGGQDDFARDKSDAYLDEKECYNITLSTPIDGVRKMI